MNTLPYTRMLADRQRSASPSVGTLPQSGAPHKSEKRFILDGAPLSRDTCRRGQGTANEAHRVGFRFDSRSHADGGRLGRTVQARKVLLSWAETISSSRD